MLLTTSFSHLVNSKICGALDHRFPLLLQARMRETTMVMLFSLCVGMYVCPSSCGAQECGNNPMKQVLSVAKRTGEIGERPSTYHSFSTELCHENSVEKRRVYTHGGHLDIKNHFHEELSQWNPQSWRPLHRFYNIMRSDVFLFLNWHKHLDYSESENTSWRHIDHQETRQNFGWWLVP